MADGFAAEKSTIRGYASDVEKEVDGWSKAGNTIKSAKLDSSAFTNEGARLANAYEEIVEDYSWYAWRIGVTLDRVAGALHATASNYGKTEAIVKDDINNVGKSF